MTRIALPQIASTAWEHPADRAALNTLRAIPGFDDVVRRVAGFFGERGIRHMFTANAVRVGPTQFPELHELFTEVLETFDWAERPELFVSQTPVVNASAIGFERPFIVINSGMLDILDREERRFILAHELAHIMSGHTTYRTIALIILTVGLTGLPFIANIALLPFQIALLEWYRKSELSCDRAGFLNVQSAETAQRTFLKLAGGLDATDLDAFLTQSREYETDTGAWDKVLKVMNTAFRDHPFATVRAAELQRYLESGAYERILGGEYPRRGDAPNAPLGDDLREASDFYADRAREVVGTVADSIARARDAFNDAFKGSPGP
jgi:Zn-dependent protease with chaperone function